MLNLKLDLEMEPIKYNKRPNHYINRKNLRLD